uniref:Uncharacterized protein n=1 Tax=Rhizophora mucronata TaxID=61149 RepID=A0A2P2P9C2_RHIMU
MLLPLEAVPRGQKAYSLLANIKAIYTSPSYLSNYL